MGPMRLQGSNHKMDDLGKITYHGPTPAAVESGGSERVYSAASRYSRINPFDRMGLDRRGEMRSMPGKLGEIGGTRPIFG